jgi:hypothetical protein
MKTVWIAFIAGMMIGGSAGFCFACLIQVSRDDKFWRDRIKGGGIKDAEKSMD